MKLLLPLVIFLGCIIPASAQSGSDLAERRIKTSVIRTEDARKGVTAIKTTFSRYDKRGNVTELIEYGQDSTIQKWEKTGYNKRGDETLLEELDAQGKTLKKTTTTYNRRGDETERVVYDEKGAVSERTVIQYNNFNEKISETTSDAAGNVQRETLYTYDSKGMISSRKTYGPGRKLLLSREYKYEY